MTADNPPLQPSDPSWLNAGQQAALVRAEDDLRLLAERRRQALKRLSQQEARREEEITELAGGIAALDQKIRNARSDLRRQRHELDKRLTMWLQPGGHIEVWMVPAVHLTLALLVGLAVFASEAAWRYLNPVGPLDAVGEDYFNWLLLIPVIAAILVLITVFALHYIKLIIKMVTGGAVITLLLYAFNLVSEDVLSGTLAQSAVKFLFAKQSSLSYMIIAAAAVGIFLIMRKRGSKGRIIAVHMATSALFRFWFRKKYRAFENFERALALDENRQSSLRGAHAEKAARLSARREQLQTPYEDARRRIIETARHEVIARNGGQWDSWRLTLLNLEIERLRSLGWDEGKPAAA